MISDAEVRREARRAGVQPSVIDLDYALGWTLWGLSAHDSLNHRLLFKGGTCLHKCYIPGSRFSEDLDFTMLESMKWSMLERAVYETLERVSADSGIDFGVQAPRCEILPGEWGDSMQMRLYFRGPHISSGSPRGMRLDFSGNESVCFPGTRRSVHHPYSDASEMGDVLWPCYSLEEMMSEKVRALVGQRRYAISRDLYDVWAIARMGIDEEGVRAALPTKLAAKGVSSSGGGVDRLLGRREEFEIDWNRNLAILLPRSEPVAFDHAWDSALQFVERVVSPP